MFSYKFYPKPENFTPSWMVWMVTFSKSAYTKQRHHNHWCRIGFVNYIDESEAVCLKLVKLG